MPEALVYSYLGYDTKEISFSLNKNKEGVSP